MIIVAKSLYKNIKKIIPSAFEKSRILEPPGVQCDVRSRAGVQEGLAQVVVCDQQLPAAAVRHLLSQANNQQVSLEVEEG